MDIVTPPNLSEVNNQFLGTPSLKSIVSKIDNLNFPIKLFELLGGLHKLLNIKLKLSTGFNSILTSECELMIAIYESSIAQ